jgi:hypothetical protein
MAADGFIGSGPPGANASAAVSPFAGGREGHDAMIRRSFDRSSSGDRAADRMSIRSSASERCCDSARLNIIKIEDRV